MHLNVLPSKHMCSIVFSAKYSVHLTHITVLHQHSNLSAILTNDVIVKFGTHK